jgi:hypothetical protein
MEHSRQPAVEHHRALQPGWLSCGKANVLPNGIRVFNSARFNGHIVKSNRFYLLSVADSLMYFYFQNAKADARGLSLLGIQYEPIALGKEHIFPSVTRLAVGPQVSIPAQIDTKILELLDCHTVAGSPIWLVAPFNRFPHRFPLWDAEEQDEAA